jgi:ubiquinone biosynthesis protein
MSLVDFGLVGRVDHRLRTDLGACLMALGSENLEFVAQVLCDMGGVLDQDVARDFQQEMITLLDRYSSIPLGKLNFQAAFLEGMDLIRKFRLDVPRDFVLIARALVIVNGIVTQLDPGLDIGGLAEPYGRKLLREKLSRRGLQRALSGGAYQLGSLLKEGPRDIVRLLRKMQRGAFEFTIRHEGFEKGLKELDQTGNRLSLSIILAAIIVASTMLLTSGEWRVTMLGFQVNPLGVAGLLFGSVIGAWLVIGILRSGRL